MRDCNALIEPFQGASLLAWCELFVHIVNHLPEKAGDRHLGPVALPFLILCAACGQITFLHPLHHSYSRHCPLRIIPNRTPCCPIAASLEVSNTFLALLDPNSAASPHHHVHRLLRVFIHQTFLLLGRDTSTMAHNSTFSVLNFHSSGSQFLRIFRQQYPVPTLLPLL
jgi:hypothetical protein